MAMTFHDLRTLASMTQEQAAAYLYCGRATYQRIERDNNDPARLELFQYKLEEDFVNRFAASVQIPVRLIGDSARALFRTQLDFMQSNTNEVTK